MAERPYTLLSWAMSLDGYLDDASGTRLVLSSPSDLDRVDAVRAAVDAVLVGAATVRADDPGLVVRADERRAHRVARGRTPSPLKVTVTTGADLEPTAALFSTGADDTTVYCGDDAAPTARARLAGLATVVDAGPCPSMRWVSEHLARRGVRSLLVEGGRHVHTQFLAAGLADELHVAVAPFFVADSRATRVVGDGPLPWDRERRADLAEVRRLEDVVLLRYALSARFDPDGPGGAAA